MSHAMVLHASPQSQHICRSDPETLCARGHLQRHILCIHGSASFPNLRTVSCAVTQAKTLALLSSHTTRSITGRPTTLCSATAAQQQDPRQEKEKAQQVTDDESSEDDVFDEAAHAARWQALMAQIRMHETVGTAPADGATIQGKDEPCIEAESSSTLFPKEDRGYAQAKTYALNVLSRRLIPVSVMEDKLRKRLYGETIIKQVVDTMKDLKLLDDRLYAEGFARSKWQLQKKSPELIRRDLIQKKVPRPFIEAALVSVFGDNLKVQRPSRHEQQQEADVMAELITDAERHFATLQRYPVDKQRRRMSDWLLRRGHSWAVVKTVLQALKL